MTNLRQRLTEYFSKPHLLFICISFSLNIFPLLILSPLTPLVILDACNGNTSKAALYSGFAVGIGSLCGFFSSPVLGILSDRYGRKPFLLLNVVAVGINLIGLLIVYHTNAIWVTFLTHIIAGIISSTWAMSFVYTADISTEEDRSKSFGILGASAGVAAILGPGVAAGASLHAMDTPLIIGLSVVGLNLLFTAFVLPESRQKCTDEKLSFKHVNTFASFKLLFSNPLVFGLAIGFCLNQICQFGILGTSVLYDRAVFGWSAFEVGLSYCIFGLVLMLTQGILLRPAVRYFGERPTILAGMMITCIVTLLFSFVNGWYTFIVVPFKAIGSVAIPIVQALISKQYSTEVQGKLLGALGGLQTLSGFLGPILFSSLYSHFTSERSDVYLPQIIFYVGCGVEFLALSVVFGIFWRVREVKEVQVGDEVEIVTVVEEKKEDDTPLTPEA